MNPQYKVIRALPDLPCGTEIKYSSRFRCYQPGDETKVSKIRLKPDMVENSPEWFEEITPKGKPCESCGKLIPTHYKSGEKNYNLKSQKFCSVQCSANVHSKDKAVNFKRGQKIHKGNINNPFPIKLKHLKPFLEKDAYSRGVSLHCRILEILAAYKKGCEGDKSILIKNDHHSRIGKSCPSVIAV